MKKSNWFAWLKRFFGFGKKVEKKIVDEKTGVIDLTYPVEAYKVEHKKHYEARDILVKKIEESKLKTKKVQADNFNKRLDDLKISVESHYGKKRIEFDIPEVKRQRVIIEPQDTFLESMALGYMTDSTVEGTLLGGDMLGAAIGDMLNTSDDTPSYNEPTYDEPRGFDNGFGDGGFSGGGAGADYSDNTPTYESPSYESPSYESPSYDGGSSYDNSSYDSPSYDSPSRDDW